MIITPGKVFSENEAITRTKLNLLGIPSVSLEALEVKDANIESVSGTKVSNIPVDSLGDDVQAKFGLKNYIPNPQFNNWINGVSVALAASGSAVLGWDYTNAGSVSGYIQRADVLAGESDSILKDAENWLQIATSSTSASAFSLHCKIPNARLLSGQDITLSFATRIFSGTVSSVSCSVVQNFGTGGSPSAEVETAGTMDEQPAVSTAKNYANITIPSVSDKTFGTNDDSYLQIKIIIANCNTTFNLGIANVQMETGDSSTSFENSVARKTGWDGFIDNSISQGLLTLSTGVPIMHTNVSAATSVYFTPYRGNAITLWNGSMWVPVKFVETALSLSGYTANALYDIFVSLSNDVITVSSLAWTSSGAGTSARATALAMYDGVYCKSGDKRLRFVGTILIDATTGQCSYEPVVGTTLVRLNVYNFNPSYIQKGWIAEATDNNYTTAAWREYNGAGHYIKFVNGSPTSSLYRLKLAGLFKSNSGANSAIGADLNASTGPEPFTTVYTSLADNAYHENNTKHTIVPGYNYFSLIQTGSGAGGDFYEAWMEIESINQ